jgi:hypothetical protein
MLALAGAAVAAFRSLIAGTAHYAALDGGFRLDLLAVGTLAMVLVIAAVARSCARWPASSAADPRPGPPPPEPGRSRP